MPISSHASTPFIPPVEITEDTTIILDESQALPTQNPTQNPPDIFDTKLPDLETTNVLLDETELPILQTEINTEALTPGFAETANPQIPIEFTKMTEDTTNSEDNEFETFAPPVTDLGKTLPIEINDENMILDTVVRSKLSKKYYFTNKKTLLTFFVVTNPLLLTPRTNLAYFAGAVLGIPGHNNCFCMIFDFICMIILFMLNVRCRF